MFLILVFMLLFAMVGGGIGIERGRPILGTVLGFWLGLVGWWIIWLIPRTAGAQADYELKVAQEKKLRG